MEDAVRPTTKSLRAARRALSCAMATAYCLSMRSECMVSSASRKQSHAPELEITAVFFAKPAPRACGRGNGEREVAALVGLTAEFVKMAEAAVVAPGVTFLPSLSYADDINYKISLRDVIRFLEVTKQDQTLLRLKKAEMTYTWAGKDRIIIDHTEVDDDLRGQGVGLQMVEAAVSFAREKHGRSRNDKDIFFEPVTFAITHTTTQ